MSRPCYWCEFDTEMDDSNEITWIWISKLKNIPKPVYTPFAFCTDCSRELADFVQRRHKK